MKTGEEILGFLHCRLQYKRIASVVAFLSMTVSGAVYAVGVDSLSLQRTGFVQTTTDAWTKCVPAFNRLNDELYANAVSNSASEEHAIASIARSIR